MEVWVHPQYPSETDLHVSRSGVVSQINTRRWRAENKGAWHLLRGSHYGLLAGVTDERKRSGQTDHVLMGCSQCAHLLHWPRSSYRQCYTSMYHVDHLLLYTESAL